MARLNRRTTPRVRDGRVQKKNSWRPARGDYWVLPPDAIQFDRRRPADGHRHVITISHLRTFLPLLPDWDEAAVGLRAVVLDSAIDCYGWYEAGVVALCNWEQDLWSLEPPGFLRNHAELLALLGIECVLPSESQLREINELLTEIDLAPIALEECAWRELRWTEAQARAFLLLYTLPHELGHHHDRMTNRSRSRVARGEPYADEYAKLALDTIWPLYARHFDL
jgi:hypothetical protein